MDEVITGFRVALRRRPGAPGACAPTSTCLGKIVGGGLPAAAFGGRARRDGAARARGRRLPGRHALGEPARDGRRPRDAASCCATPGAYDRLEATAAALDDGAAPAPGVTVNRVGAMLTAFFHPGPVRSFADAAASDTARFARFHAHMLARGVYLAPSQFEALMPSLAHTPEQVEQTAAAAAEFAGVSVLREVADRAAADSPLWAQALLPGARAGAAALRRALPRAHLLGRGDDLRGLPAALRPLAAVLAGRRRPGAAHRRLPVRGRAGEICATGDLPAVGALATLISRCARNQADGAGADDRGALGRDGGRCLLQLTSGDSPPLDGGQSPG